MKKRLRLLAWVLSLAMLCQMLPFAAFAETSSTIGDDFSFEFAGGDGTAENPYQIITREQMENINKHPSANYILMSDLDFGKDSNWTPICSDDSLVFSGVFDGNYHTINNLVINSDNSTSSHYSGLFGCASGTIKNLKLTGVSITVTNPANINFVHIGSIAAYGGTISNCSARGRINVTNSSNSVIDVGGLVGHLLVSGSTMTDCQNYVDIELDVSGCSVVCGGLIGCGQAQSSDGPLSSISSGKNVVQYCDNYGSITAAIGSQMYANYMTIGGISGYMDESSCIIDHCRNYGSLSASGTGESRLYGIAKNPGTTENCVNYGTISSTSDAWITTGITSADSSNTTNCYQVAADISSEHGEVFRISGSSSISECYALESASVNDARPSEYLGSNDRNGENLTKEEISAKIKEIFPNDDPFPEPEPTPQKEFTFKRDNLGFLNSSEYFFSKEDANMISEWKKVFKESVKDNNNKNIVNKYEETPAGFLLRHVEHLEQCSDILYGHNISTESLHRLVDGMSSRVKENIVLHRLSGWGGSCYGMEVVAALRYMNPSLLPSEKNSFDMAPPYDRTTNTHNRDTEDLVEFYYLQQYLPSAKLHSDNQHRLFNTAPSNALNEIVQTLKKGKVVPVAIHCSSGGFHEVILTDLLGKTDAGSYIFVVNDPNSFDPQQMEIKPTTVDDTECFESDSTQPAEHLEIEYKCAGFEFDYLEFYMTKTDQLDLINYYSNERNETLTDYSDLEIVVRLSSSLEATSGDSHLSTKSGSIQNASNDVRAQFSIGVPAGSSDSSDDLVTYSMEFQEDGTPFEMKISPESNGKAMTLVTLKDSSFFLSTTEETAITVDPAKQTVHIETDDPGSVGLMYSQDKTTDAWPWESIAIDTTQTSYLDLTVEDDGVHITGDGLKNAQAVVGVEDSTKDIPFGENVSNDAVIRQEESGKLTLNGAEIDTPSTPSEPSTPSSPSTPAAPSGGSGDGDGSGAGALLLVGAGAAAAAITAGVVLSMPVEVQGKAELADHTALPGAKISLLQDGKVVEQTTADDAGAFALKVRRGSYQLTAAYTDANGQIIHQTIDIKAPAKDLVVTF